MHNQAAPPQQQAQVQPPYPYEVPVLGDEEMYFQVIRNIPDQVQQPVVQVEVHDTLR
jgi:hypothetical protein